MASFTPSDTGCGLQQQLRLVQRTTNTVYLLTLVLANSNIVVKVERAKAKDSTARAI